ncbi:MAG: hypothetical protein J6W64_08035 [Bacilli bacterium]|nr:hypothetical protein [Bacilli bacterium]
MKNYSENLTIENVDQKISEFIKDFNSEIKNTKVEHTKFGFGTINSIDDDVCSYEVRDYETKKIIIDDQEVEKQVLVTKWQKDLTCSVLFDTMRRFSLKVAIDSGRLKLLENEKIIKDYLAIGEPLLKVLCEKEAKEKAEYEAEQRRIEEEKQAKIKEEKMKEKAEKKKKELLDYTKTLDRTASCIYTGDEFYIALGWLAKHTKKISAVMPDYLEDWFVNVFGNDAERKAVDSKLKTSGGFQYQWSLAVTLDLDTNENIPLILTQYLSKSETKKGKRLSNTEFIYKIAKDYGFKFGKVQDLDEIKKYIPTNMLEDFNLGYNA